MNNTCSLRETPKAAASLSAEWPMTSLLKKKFTKLVMTSFKVAGISKWASTFSVYLFNNGIEIYNCFFAETGQATTHLHDVILHAV